MYFPVVGGRKNQDDYNNSGSQKDRRVQGTVYCRFKFMNGFKTRESNNFWKKIYKKTLVSAIIQTIN